ncbi:MAG: outer membrane lipoprotein carrier protein LolA [Deltaproteobacteria bacterium]|nr:outer membrane lipoprotein carrier protein LolA [Deltaproteobacteria bacterium]
MKSIVYGLWSMVLLISPLMADASQVSKVSEQSEREGEAPPALPVEGALLAPKIEETYQNTNTLQAEFTQSTYVPLLEKTITRPGRLFYQKGGKLRIEYAGGGQDPALPGREANSKSLRSTNRMTHYISDGKTLWVFDPQSKEKQSYLLKDSGLPEEALKFLTELGNLTTYFNVTEKKEKLILKPKKKSTYSSLDCLFEKNNYLTDLTIHSHSGNTSQYRFFNIKPGIKFPAKLFTL